MRKVLVLGLLFGTLAAWTTGCSGDDDDDGHTAPDSITVSGGTAVTVGSSLQLTATAVGGSEPGDITTESAWTTNSAGVATVGAATGLVTGVSAGTATISAEHDGVIGMTTITVSTAGAAAFTATVSGDWSGAHPGTAYDYYVRVIDTADDSVVFCDSQNVVAIFNVVTPAILIAGHSYIAQALVDLDGNGNANESPHKYESPAPVLVNGNTNFPITPGPNDTANPNWTGPACP
jgi:hypothetical protein